MQKWTKSDHMDHGVSDKIGKTAFSQPALMFRSIQKDACSSYLFFHFVRHISSPKFYQF